MKVTVAKALKLKNRIANKINEVSASIQAYNSVISGQERPVDINKLMEKRSKLVDRLISLKTAINNANIPIQSTVYLLAELKGELSFLRSLDTTNGKQVSMTTWGDGDKVYEKDAVLDYAFVKGLIDQVENDIDTNQDKLDNYNHRVEIDVSDEVFSLIKG